LHNPVWVPNIGEGIHCEKKSLDRFLVTRKTFYYGDNGRLNILIEAAKNNNL